MALISRRLDRLLAALLMTMLAQTAMADPPGRVGRLAELQGQVWFYDDETADWVAAVRNRPLTTGDRVSTGADGRAALSVGSSSLRLGPGSEIEVLQLDDDIVRVQLHNGLLALRLRTHDAAREVELVTAEGRFKPDRAGRYRLDRVDATSRATVWSGQLLFVAPDNAVTLATGQRADVWSDGRTQVALIEPQRDAFGDEVAAADLNDEQSVSARYVSPEMTGIEDLDRHGRWQSDPEYGALWVPRVVVPGWAPYRFGHWAWIAPWGWTWVDDAPWGFAPFHYGRWVYRHEAWCWSPGQRVARPFYAPALVAWVGSGPVGVAVGVGPNVGWFPLAPREVFVPGYRASPSYVRNVNVSHVTNITNITTIVNNPNAVVQQTNYVHRGVPGAMTFVPASVVSGRRPVAPARVQLTDPRPGDGDRRGIAAGMPTVIAVPPLQAPAFAHDRGAGPARGAPAFGGGHPVSRPVRAIAAPGEAPQAVAPARGIPPSPATAPPVVRATRPAGEGVSPPPNANTAPYRPSPALPRVAPVSPAPVAQTAPPIVRPAPPTAAAAAPAPPPPAVAPAVPQRQPLPMPIEGQARHPSPPASPRHEAPAAGIPHAPTAAPAVAAPTPAPAMVAPAPAPKPAPRAREPRDEPREKGKAEK